MEYRTAYIHVRRVKILQEWEKIKYGPSAERKIGRPIERRFVEKNVILGSEQAIGINP